VEKYLGNGLGSGNFFLDSLQGDTRSRLMSQLVPVTLKKGEVLAEPERERDHVYFPVKSVISVVTRLSDGAAVEVGIAGHEGMSAPSIAFGAEISMYTVVVQVAGSAHAIVAETFAEQLRGDTHLRNRVLAYMQYSFGAAMQFAACNRRHLIPARFACSVLMATDRMGSTLTQTHEEQATTLGVRRAGISLAAESLAEAGVISYRRGRLTVLDRERLEAASCECYATLNELLIRCMGYGARVSSPMAMTA
jgi:CRP-like cAMP-binding protein